MKFPSWVRGTGIRIFVQFLREFFSCSTLEREMTGILGDFRSVPFTCCPSTKSLVLAFFFRGMINYTITDYEWKDKGGKKLCSIDRLSFLDLRFDCCRHHDFSLSNQNCPVHILCHFFLSFWSEILLDSFFRYVFRYLKVILWLAHAYIFLSRLDCPSVTVQILFPYSQLSSSAHFLTAALCFR
jgi:hypothetical protein